MPWAEQKYYAWAQATFRDEPLLIARTGYTGEDGFELLVRADDAAVLWDSLLVAGEPHGLVPAGLAARDTLRLEAGMPLYGHELTTETKPAQAGLGRVVAATVATSVAVLVLAPHIDGILHVTTERLGSIAHVAVAGMLFGGGLLLEVDGEVVGAIGVSAGSVEQDVSVAEAGVAAL